MDWGEYAAAFATFLLSHALPVRPVVKARLAGALGRRGFTVAYSALSLIALVWLVGAAGRAPFVRLWSPATWQAHVTLAAMAAACLLLAFGLFRANPFSFGGSGGAGFDPARPGVVRWTRHPLLAALALWSAGHVPPNGDLAHVLLFGGFAGFALLGMAMIDRRRAGAPEQRRLRDAVAAGPFIPVPASWAGAAARAAAGAALLALLLLAHPHVIGVSPFW